VSLKSGRKEDSDGNNGNDVGHRAHPGDHGEGGHGGEGSKVTEVGHAGGLWSQEENGIPMQTMKLILDTGLTLVIMEKEDMVMMWIK